MRMYGGVMYESKRRARILRFRFSFSVMKTDHGMYFPLMAHVLRYALNKTSHRAVESPRRLRHTNP